VQNSTYTPRNFGLYTSQTENLGGIPELYNYSTTGAGWLELIYDKLFEVRELHSSFKFIY